MRVAELKHAFAVLARQQQKGGRVLFAFARMFNTNRDMLMRRARARRLERIICGDDDA